MMAVIRTALPPFKTYIMIMAALGTAGFIAGATANLIFALQHPDVDPYRERFRQIPSFLAAPPIWLPNRSEPTAHPIPRDSTRQYEAVTEIHPNGSRTVKITSRGPDGITIIREITESVQYIDTRGKNNDYICDKQFDQSGLEVGSTCRPK